jgi:hypothetical protein
MLFRETIAVYCENDTDHRDTLCGKNGEFYNPKASGTYRQHLYIILDKANEHFGIESELN